MAEWRVYYRDQLDQDRILAQITSREAALKLAKTLYREKRAELYMIEGPNGLALAKQELMRWVSDNRYT